MSEHVTMARRPFAMVSHDFITESIKLVGPSAACVYLYLVKCSGSDDSCFPSSQHMADALGMSEKTVRTAIQALKDANLVTVVPRIRENGSRTSNLIVIHDPVNITDCPPVNFTGGVGQILPGHKKNHSEIDREYINTLDAEKITAPTFADFWSAWPKKIDKPDAAKVWAKLTNADKQNAVDRLAAWLPYFQSIEKNYIPGPAKWLRARHWEDDETPQPVASLNGHKSGHVHRGFKKATGEVL